MLRNRLGLPQQSHINPKLKKEKEKGVATSLFASALCWPLASLVLRRHVFSVGTCSPCSHVHRALTCASLKTSLHQHSDSDLSLALLSLPTPTPHTDFQSNLNTTFITHLSLHSDLQHFPRPLFGRVLSISANRERTRPPPPAFLVTVTGSFFYTSTWLMCWRTFLSCTPPP